MPAAENNVMIVESSLIENEEPTWNEILKAAPTNFSWNKWDQWFQDVPH